jgi:hypothetical protein
MSLGAGRIFAINLLANSKPAEDAFARVGKAAGRIPTPMKVAAAAITAAFVAVTAVAVKSFRALLDLGEEFNEVSRIIRVGTGAVGGDLAALEQSFRDVAAAVPNAFADIATVVAELDTRTDLAGEGLEEMAVQLLTLSRLMGGDVKGTTREVTRLFNRFGLSAEESADMLDLLFRASQASGAEVSQLAADVTKNAGALRGMGLSLEESVALIALFEREGVRTRTVVSALQTGFLKLTKDGALPLNEALAATFEELQTLDREAAVAKGFEIFGTSALELVDAVRDGRLSIEDFTKQIVDGESTIIGVAEETDGWRQKLDELKNFLKLTFEPVAREVFKQVTAFVDQLKPAAQRIVDAFERDGLQGALEQVGIEWNTIYEEQLKPLFLRLIEFLDEVVKPLALEVGEAIGRAIVSGIGKALRASLPSLKDAFLELSPPTDPTGGRRGPGTPGSTLTQQDIDLLNSLFPAAPTPAPARPSPSTSPAGSGSPNRTLAPPTRFTEYAPGMFAAVPFADGGIVMSPVLGLVGEAGPEAIIPLDRMGQMGGQTIVNVTVTSADPQAVVEAIRRYTRANGPLSGVVNV